MATVRACSDMLVQVCVVSVCVRACVCVCVCARACVPVRPVGVYVCVYVKQKAPKNIGF